MSKRRNGECSIFVYRNGYAAYAWVTTPEGERKRKWVYGKTHDEVHAKWIKLQGQASEGPVPTSVPTVSQYMNYWLREVVNGLMHILSTGCQWSASEEPSAGKYSVRLFRPVELGWHARSYA